MTDRQLPSDYPRTFHKANLTGDDYERGGEDRPVVSIDEANVVSSIRSGNTPTPLDPDSDRHDEDDSEAAVLIEDGSVVQR